MAITEFQKRRSELMAMMGYEGIAIVNGAHLMQRNSDVDFPFRQHSDMLYLSGFPEPEAVLVLIPGREHGETILFCQERDEESERWTGEITGPERARQLYGVDDAFPFNDIDEILPGLLENRQRVYYSMGEDRNFDERLLRWVHGLSGYRQSGGHSPGEFVQLGQYLHELRLFKSQTELALMRRAADITVQAHERLMQSAVPGQFEYQLEATLLHEFMIQGARYPAYPCIVGSGDNACVMHYVDNGRRIEDGDLVLVDAGCEYEGYAADVTRTFPINGRFTTPQREIYEVVLSAHEAAVAEIMPGNHWNQPHMAAMRAVTEGLVQLNILEGDIDILMAEEAYRPYTMHRTGHWLGLDVHDVGEYRVEDQWRVFEQGMVTTIEPGIYLASDVAEIPERYRGIGIRIEDDLLLTRKGHEILTDRLVRDAAGIEALMANP
ncbi:MAG: Xaa-Pro aminopeptidase [Gammaproteobacteria bacterium]|nr:Xaa-Pro aminopeptidase [Gammaproteobacteria bacterium]MAW30036.1 Xaa-Pro aminopeptidase [Gammaproteobacteria bacterium]OUU06484.1 MAG: Xaa-Pro aminopeptidase [Gammaproteobacteria bacterium TMED34]OUU08630.1 MAG: Xaa-Pro aminopeptidase [Gammaproteobacteria bacterium TMED34]